MSDCDCPPDKGHVHPRIWTPELRELTPATSQGFALLKMCDLLGLRLDPWQRWLAIHAMETDPSDPRRPRFREVLLIVSRQNGKTTFAGVWLLFRLLVLKDQLVLAAAHNKETALDLWTSVTDMIEKTPALTKQMARPRVSGSGREKTLLTGGRTYMPLATSEGTGRSKSADSVFLDELREHKTFGAWASIGGTMTAKHHAQLFATSSAGSQFSVVLSQLRDSATAAIQEGRTDSPIGLFEHSARPDRNVTDIEGWREANPAFGTRISRQTVDGLISGSTPIGVLRTEHLGQWITVRSAPIDMAAWDSGEDPMFTLSSAVDAGLISAALDISPDSKHIALVAAGPLGDVTGFDVIATWSGTDAIVSMGLEVAGLLAALGVSQVIVSQGASDVLLPTLTGAKVAAKLASKSDTVAACMLLSERVTSRRLRHSGHALLAAQLSVARRQVSGDGWRFARQGEGYVTALYGTALAVAASIERGTPAPLEFILPDEKDLI